MTRQEFINLLKRKFSSLLMVIIPAFVIMLIIMILLQLLPLFVSEEIIKSWEDNFIYYMKNPDALKSMLIAKGSDSEWIFILAQVLQVIIAPIPGQVAAFAGGFIFGFWKGWLLTTLGLFIGSFIAMAGARLLGFKLVRLIVPDKIIKRFDSVINEGGYMTFFMIFLLPALPDDAVCFLAGLTKLKLLPLSIVCLIGRAPGMIVLCLTGAGFAGGFALSVQILFAVMMIISVILWLFWEVIEKWIYKFLNISQDKS